MKNDQNIEFLLSTWVSEHPVDISTACLLEIEDNNMLKIHSSSPSRFSHLIALHIRLRNGAERHLQTIYWMKNRRLRAFFGTWRTIFVDDSIDFLLVGATRRLPLFDRYCHVNTDVDADHRISLADWFIFFGLLIKPLRSKTNRKSKICGWIRFSSTAGKWIDLIENVQHVWTAIHSSA